MKLTRVVDTWKTIPFFNFCFGILYGLCSYFYFMAMLEDPGYISRKGSREDQKTIVQDLMNVGKFDERNFCIHCIIQKPLRSKHCRRCGHCVAKQDQ